MEEITLTIDGIQVTAPKGSTILEAARVAGINIPTLCYLKDVQNDIGACRICVVEVEGSKKLAASCVFPASEGMVVKTHTPKILDYRKKTLELLLSNHNKDCLACVRNGNCELQELCKQYGVTDSDFYSGEKTPTVIDDSAPHMIRDNSKCILCRRCVAACSNIQGVGILGANNRGFHTEIGCAFDLPIGETSCINCGQCIAVCPTGALREKDNIDEVFDAINDPNKTVLVSAAPAVRAAICESFEMPIGTDGQGRLAAALRRLNFDKVFDTVFSADLTIMEEATELLDRINNGGTLPLITSCSPGWVKYCEHYYPEFTENLSSCKSPQQMFGAVAKSYYAEEIGVSPENIVMVSIMPCTAKKYEIGRPDQDANGVPDVDYVLTTRELGRMIKRAGIRFEELPEEDFDKPLGLGTGAGVIFGATGGVMEAALRTAVETLTGESLDNESLEFKEVRGFAGIKEASYNVAGLEIKAAVASGLENARELLDMVARGEAEYHFIEIMACPGGCINGGGQPHVPAGIRNFMDIREARAKILYDLDRSNTMRKSHENPAIIEIYDKYLEKPGSKRAHELLHTTYVKRTVNKPIKRNY